MCCRCKSTTHPPHNWCFGSQRVYFTTVCCRRACKSTTPSPTELSLRFKDCSSLLCAVDVLARAGTSKVLCGRSKLDQHHLLNIALCSTVSHLSYCDGKYWSIWHGQLKRPMYKWLQSFKHSLRNDAAACLYTASVRSSVIHGGNWPSHA